MNSSGARTIDATAFLAEYPEYGETTVLDELRDTEYAYLDEQRQVYLDYTGAGLAATAQHRAHDEWVTAGCYGNPHSDNPTSLAATARVEAARAAVYAYFNAAPEKYAVIFTANATAACRLVGEAYPFDRSTTLVLTADNHNSVNGLRAFAAAKHARTEYAYITGTELRVSEQSVRAALSRRSLREICAVTTTRGTRRRGLFAYPAQSNFSGVQHPLEWVELAHEYGFDVLLDAAAYVPANTLDLEAVPADFVPVSWYKVFGYPTGVGCLIARRDALARLRRPWFAGGSIRAVSVRGGWHTMAPGGTAFEDGTANFLAVPDVEHGIDWVRGIGMDVIRQRTRCLTGWLLDRLAALEHDNGMPLVRIYGPRTMVGRGATVALNILDPAGAVVDERLVARESSAAGLSLRTGCFCNPGSGEAAFGLDRTALRRMAGRQVRTIDEYVAAIGLPSGGAIRVSLGIASNFSDVQRFIDFVGTYRNRPCDGHELPPREQC
ncbi:aminotransferase class V-fold PLP-dependent enzyme [Nocardia wallacei]|uniref:aminotransferase class V-fold PLP-dependent enzyme n=1 Tax=Nocardia wallacei TaxID=480035 RepID=UPI00245591BD|nr:aminotransferase class V-fold PLP-dependent enzyme [Nocardia wallacei]